MRSIHIFIPLLAVAAGTATAQPKEESGNRVRIMAPKSKPKASNGWIELASPIPAWHGTEFIIVPPETGSVPQLRVDALDGTVIVLRARIYYTGGKVQTMELGRRLDPRHKSTLIDLPAAKKIDEIALTTETYTRGTYALYAASSELGVATR